AQDSIGNQGQLNAQPTEGNVQRSIPNIKAQSRNVIPQQKLNYAQKDEPQQQQEISKVASAEAGFCQLIGDATEGTLARFVDNKLQVLIWSRSPRDSNVIFGAQLSLPQLIQELSPLIEPAEPALQ